MTLFTFKYRRNKHVKAISVPPPCIGLIAITKDGYFYLLVGKIRIKNGCLGWDVALRRVISGRRDNLSLVEERPFFKLMSMVPV